MNKIVFFDTETTGLPVWDQPSESEVQPHLVQLAAIVADANTRKVVSSIDLTIKADGWDVPDEVSAIHGITKEKSLQVGVDEQMAIEIFLELIQGAKKIVAHSSTFDQRIMRIALKRYFTETEVEAWANKEIHYCTMRESKEIVGATGANGRVKNPKLTEAYKFFTGEEMQDAHTAMADAQACMAVYFAMNNRPEVEQAVNF